MASVAGYSCRVEATNTTAYLLLADEPAGNLDTASGRRVLEFLERMHDGGLTLVVVTHDPAVARRAGRVLVPCPPLPTLPA